MSLALGLICKDSIILAAESQTTGDRVKVLDANKVSVLSLGGKESVVVAQAGNADRSARVVEIMESSALKTVAKDSETVPNLIKNALMQARIEMREQMFNCSAEDLREYIWKHDQDCWIMAAHYFKGEPEIYIGIFSEGVCTRATTSKRAEFKPRHFAAIGTGADLAIYLLKEHNSLMEFPEAFALALYVVEEVKAHDKYCGGETHLAYIDKSNVTSRIDQQSVNDISSGIRQMSVEIREERNHQLANALQQLAGSLNEIRTSKF